MNEGRAHLNSATDVLVETASDANAEDGSSPALSVVLPTDRLETVRKSLGHLLGQTAVEQLELVIVSPRAGEMADAPELAGFRHRRIVELSAITSLGEARAAGVRAARSPFVTIAETHSFPDPNWAAALIAAHRRSWTAVGPAIVNDNPESAASWANLFHNYSPWIDPPDGPASDLPGHGTSYVRGVLLEFDSDLDAMLEAGSSVLHSELAARGHRLYLEPAAKLQHRNVARAVPTVLVRFHVGRSFASTRARRWPAAKRFAYAAAAPLIPAVRLRRIIRALATKNARDRLPRALPMLVLALAASATGELVGYARGASDGASSTVLGHELHR